MGEEKNIYTSYKIDYDQIEENNFQYDVQEALKFYLNEKDNINTCLVKGFLLNAKALNPFLRIVESLNESSRFIILPTKYYVDKWDETGTPQYFLIWTNKKECPIEIVTKNI